MSKWTSAEWTNGEGRVMLLAMKMIWAFFGMVLFASGQLVVPKEGWKRIAKGERKIDGRHFLGIWQKRDESVAVGVVWAEELPELKVLFGLGHFEEGEGGIDPSFFPKEAALLEAPRLGLKIRFEAQAKEEEDQEHYWIWSEKGGALLKVVLDDQGVFSLGDWGFGESPKDPDGEMRKELGAIVNYINKHAALPHIKIDDDVLPPIGGGSKLNKNAPRIRVNVSAEGKYFIEGKELSHEALEAALKKASELDDAMVLLISAEKEVDFKFVQRLIKLAASAGIDQLAYGAFKQQK